MVASIVYVASYASTTKSYLVCLNHIHYSMANQVHSNDTTNEKTSNSSSILRIDKPKIISEL